MISPEQETKPTDRDFEVAVDFWAKDLAARHPEALVPVDIYNAQQFAQHAEYLDRKNTFFEASPIGSTPEGHEQLKRKLIQFNDLMLASGEFSQFISTLSANEDFNAAIALVVDNNENVVIACNHPWLANIAHVQAAVYSAADRVDFAKDCALTLSVTLGNLDIVISKDEQGKPAMTLPAIAAGQLTSNVATSIPPSDSLDRPELWALKQSQVDFNYKANRHLVEWAVGHGQPKDDRTGKLLTTAMSASLDIISPQNSEITMKRVDEAVAKIVSKYFPNALPIATTLTTEGQFGFAIGKLRKLETANDVHTLMEEMTTPYQQLVGQPWQVGYASEK